MANGAQSASVSATSKEHTKSCFEIAFFMEVVCGIFNFLCAFARANIEVYISNKISLSTLRVFA